MCEYQANRAKIDLVRACGAPKSAAGAVHFPSDRSKSAAATFDRAPDAVNLRSCSEALNGMMRSSSKLNGTAPALLEGMYGRRPQVSSPWHNECGSLKERHGAHEDHPGADRSPGRTNVASQRYEGLKYSCTPQ